MPILLFDFFDVAWGTAPTHGMYVQSAGRTGPVRDALSCSIRHLWAARTRAAIRAFREVENQTLAPSARARYLKGQSLSSLPSSADNAFSSLDLRSTSSRPAFSRMNSGPKVFPRSSACLLSCSILL